LSLLSSVISSSFTPDLQLIGHTHSSRDTSLRRVNFDRGVTAAVLKTARRNTLPPAWLAYALVRWVMSYAFCSNFYTLSSSAKSLKIG